MQRNAWAVAWRTAQLKRARGFRQRTWMKLLRISKFEHPIADILPRTAEYTSGRSSPGNSAPGPYIKHRRIIGMQEKLDNRDWKMEKNYLA